jgi:hypothetical protein
VISVATDGRPGTLESPSPFREPKNVQVPQGTASPRKSHSRGASGSISTSTRAGRSSGTCRAIPAGAWPASTTHSRLPRNLALPIARPRPDAAPRAVAERYFVSDLVLGRRLDEVGVA